MCLYTSGTIPFHSSEATSITASNFNAVRTKQQIKPVGAEAPSIHIICGLRGFYFELDLVWSWDCTLSTFM